MTRSLLLASCLIACMTAAEPVVAPIVAPPVGPAGAVDLRPGTVVEGSILTGAVIDTADGVAVAPVLIDGVLPGTPERHVRFIGEASPAGADRIGIRVHTVTCIDASGRPVSMSCSGWIVTAGVAGVRVRTEARIEAADLLRAASLAGTDAAITATKPDVERMMRFLRPAVLGTITPGTPVSVVITEGIPDVRDVP